MHMERHLCVDLTKSLWIMDKPSYSKPSMKMIHMATQSSQTFQSMCLDPPSSILFGTPNSLILQTLLSLFQDLVIHTPSLQLPLQISDHSIFMY